MLLNAHTGIIEEPQELVWSFKGRMEGPRETPVELRMGSKTKKGGNGGWKWGYRKEE